MMYIVIPVYNRNKLLKGCLLSLRQQTNRDFTIVVVDDGSTDGTHEMLQNEFPEVVTLRGNGNLWWTGAINVGVRYALSRCADQDPLLILNDDLTVPEHYVATFFELAARHPNALIGSVVTDIDHPDVIHSGGVQINWLTARTRDTNLGKSLASFGKGYFQEVSTLTGRGVLIPSRVFRKIGVYNDRHYAQCGDTELPCRARRAGYPLIVSYDVPVFSVIREEGHINHAEKFTVAHIRKYYFNVRSNFNLRYRFWFAYDATSNPLQGTVFFVCDFLRITNHFVKRFKVF